MGLLHSLVLLAIYDCVSLQPPTIPRLAYSTDLTHPTYVDFPMQLNDKCRKLMRSAQTLMNSSESGILTNTGNGISTLVPLFTVSRVRAGAKSAKKIAFSVGRKCTI